MRICMVLLYIYFGLPHPHCHEFVQRAFIERTVFEERIPTFDEVLM
jgi:hypothetical protein